MIRDGVDLESGCCMKYSTGHDLHHSERLKVSSRMERDDDDGSRNELRYIHHVKSIFAGCSVEANFSKQNAKVVQNVPRI